MFFPVTLLGMYSPFAIRLLLRSAQRSGSVSGTVYGVSTAGHRRHTGHHLFPASLDRHARDHAHAGRTRIVAGLALLRWRDRERRGGAAFLALALLLRWRSSTARSADEPGRRQHSRRTCSSAVTASIAHIETQYNDIFITKRRSELTMSFQLKGWDYTELVDHSARAR